MRMAHLCFPLARQQSGNCAPLSETAAGAINKKLIAVSRRTVSRRRTAILYGADSHKRRTECESSPLSCKFEANPSPNPWLASPKTATPMKVSVIIPAAGLGTRMGRSAPEKEGISRKQFMLLNGSPVLIHTIRKFVSSPLVTEIVVALRRTISLGLRSCFAARDLRKQFAP